MSEHCPSCGEPVAPGSCPVCDGWDPVKTEPPSAEDPLIGRVFADRYEIRKLHGAGGMARVYRAVQKSLEREVVVKVISPELLEQGELTSEEVIARFFIEAQAASKLNHPNVVSVFDFGRTSAADGGLLFLVMEYLTGPDLYTALQQQPVMPIARVASILTQTLAALGEAHYLGIVHRDIKPENILLEPTRGGRDLVKVIDFGTAKLGGLQSVTRVGQTVGTPHYIAPEQIEGSALGSADLYAVGIILFELLTGQLPFDGSNAIEILRKHLSAERPDPRTVAPDRDIPAALAEVCMRAIHVDPQQRWATAEGLSQAIARAAGTVEWSSRVVGPAVSMLPPSPSMLPPAPLAVPRPAPAPSFGGAPTAGPPSVAPAPSKPALASRLPPPLPRTDPAGPPPRHGVQDGRSTAPAVPLSRAETPSIRPPAELLASTRPPAAPASAKTSAPFGREADVAWADEILSAKARGACVGVVGGAGSGRSWLLREIATRAERRGARVVRAHAEPTPRREVSYEGIRRIVAALVQLPEAEVGLTTGHEAGRDAAAALGLRAIFAAGHDTEAAPDPEQARAAAASALRWAARRAVDASAGGRVLLAVDDADRLDNASLSALLDGLETLDAPRFSVATTSQVALALPAERSPHRTLAGLSPAEAARFLEQLGGPRGALAGRTAEVEPLYVETLHRWRLSDAPGHVPRRLVDLVAAGLRGLVPAQRRLLLAVAVTGGGTPDELSVVARKEDLERAVDPLVAAGILEVDDADELRVAHEVFAVVALATTPIEAVTQLHEAAAESLAARPELGELRAWHAVRGRPDFETFLLVEECAALRTRLGDELGAAEILQAALVAGRTMIRHGDVEEGGSACVVFGQKLGAVLRGLGRFEEAIDVLRESLAATRPDDAVRARILEELARSGGSLGRRAEAEAWRREALAIARRLDDRALVQRLVALTRE
jgi:serine/threonine-protein kinase